MDILQLIERLHHGAHSLVVAQGSEFRCFDGRGVGDVYELSIGEPSFLRGSMLADKVIGVGAASIMILSGVREVYADVISQRALALLEREGVVVSHAQVVPYIINRLGDGQCPLESRCPEGMTLAQIKEQVDRFVAEQRNKN
ncbi:MAG: DUF1893 domain-containing protein [Rikenellaceae bacterium]